MYYSLKKWIIPFFNNYSHLALIKKLKISYKKLIFKRELVIIDQLIQDANKIYLDFSCDIMVGVAQYGENEIVNPVNDNNIRYINFLEYNNINYEVFNICQSDWLQKVLKYDLIIWAISSSPARLDEAKNKIFLLQNVLRKECFPSFDSLFSYENKILQYYLFSVFGLPHVPTFISTDREETLSYLEKCSYPIVSKICIGSGSRGVDILKNKRQALRYVNYVFSSGKKTYHTYLKQKDYIYFQEYISDSDYDLRVIVVGDKIFGYYRMKPKNDFRASGAGLVVKRDLPIEAMQIAVDCRDKLNAIMIAVDMLKSSKQNKYLIIEASIFFGIETAEQLIVNGVPGYYLYQDNQYKFVEGKYWIQDFAFLEFLKSVKSVKKSTYICNK